MDAFQIRIDFLDTLKRLSASQQSIHASLAFIAAHPAAAHDLWSCLLESCRNASLNTRINLLFLISSLFTNDSHSTPHIKATYTPLLANDIDLLLDLMVPDAQWDAILNLPTTRQVLQTWKVKHVLDRSTVTRLEARLDARETALHALPHEHKDARARWEPQDVVRRMEEDRERHKRLREGLWILPLASSSQNVLFGTELHQVNPFFLLRGSLPSHSHSAASGPNKCPRPAADTSSTATARRSADEAALLPPTPSPPPSLMVRAQDIEFEQCWEETSDLNEDDADMIREENAKNWASAVVLT